jgi:hypothetical protein
MIIIATAPNTDYPVGERVYRSDHRQIIYNVDFPDAMALLQDYKCTMPPRAIVAHTFPDGMSVHCFGCGAFIEMPAGEDPWFWFKKGEVWGDFPYYHRAHVDWVFVPPTRPKVPEIPQGGPSTLVDGHIPAPDTTIIRGELPSDNQIQPVFG